MCVGFGSDVEFHALVEAGERRVQDVGRAVFRGAGFGVRGQTLSFMSSWRQWSACRSTSSCCITCFLGLEVEGGVEWLRFKIKYVGFKLKGSGRRVQY